MPAITAPPEMPEPVIRASSIPLSLLVVEDNKTNRILMHDTLTTLGHSVTLAINGNEALEHVAREPFHLILMDLRMPGMDGLEATRRIRTLEREAGRARTPVIVVTADTDVQTREDCLDAGIDAIVIKPAPLAKLTDIIAKHTKGTTAIVRGKTATADMPLLTSQSLSDMRNDVLRIRKFTGLLLTDVEEEMSNLQVSLQRQDRQALEQTAHTLKGLCSHLQDPLLKDLAMRLQAGAQLAALPELSATADLLQSAINKIIARERKMEAL